MTPADSQLGQARQADLPATRPTPSLVSVLWYSYWILVRLLVLWILDSGTVIGSGTFINFGVFWDLGTLITLVRLFDTLEYVLKTITVAHRVGELT